MPTITATPYPALGRVLVELDWADTSWATCARAVRTVVATGVSTPLTPYINPCTVPGQYEKLSGGRAIFWDNEAPLDTPVTYTTDAIDATSAAVVRPPVFLSDSFTRVIAPGVGWGTADTGQTWISNNNAVLSVNGTQGIMTLPPSQGVFNQLFVNVTDVDLYAEFSFSSTAAYIEVDIADRWVNNNYVRLIHNGNLSIQTLVNGVVNIGAVIPMPAATSTTSLRFQVTGDSARGKGWLTGTAEPDWMVVTNNLSSFGVPAAGDTGVIGFNDTGTKTITWDNITGTYTPSPSVSITATTSAITLASNGNMWLRDPGRPCNDLLVSLCFTGDCVSGVSGVSFMAEDQETYDTNMTLLIPTNAKFPIPVNRPRRGATSTITLATKTFVARDALIQILDPGSPLLFSAPTVYGIPDRYLAINTTTISRGLTDHRVQKRLEQLPFTTVERPITTQQGTCNAQFAAMCNVYGSWGVMNAADVTWTKILYGEAGGGDLGYREWNPGVENVFANWLAVKNSKTWGTLKLGL